MCDTCKVTVFQGSVKPSSFSTLHTFFRDNLTNAHPCISICLLLVPRWSCSAQLLCLTACWTSLCRFHHYRINVSMSCIFSMTKKNLFSPAKCSSLCLYLIEQLYPSPTTWVWYFQDLLNSSLYTFYLSINSISSSN